MRWVFPSLTLGARCRWRILLYGLFDGIDLGHGGLLLITDNAGRGLEAVTLSASIIPGVVARLEGGGQCKKRIICDLVREDGEKKK